LAFAALGLRLFPPIFFFRAHRRHGVYRDRRMSSTTFPTAFPTIRSAANRLAARIDRPLLAFRAYGQTKSFASRIGHQRFTSLCAPCVSRISKPDPLIVVIVLVNMMYDVRSFLLQQTAEYRPARRSLAQTPGLYREIYRHQAKFCAHISQGRGKGMDIKSIITQVIKDIDALDGFSESLHEAMPSIERDISRLRQAPGDNETIRNLFRVMHDLKGEAGRSQIELAVAITHPIEVLLARLHGSDITFDNILAEAILLAVDRLQLAVENLSAHQSLENLRLVDLLQGLESLSTSSPGEIKKVAGNLVEAVTNFRPAAEASHLENGQTEIETMTFENGQTEVETALGDDQTASLIEPLSAQSSDDFRFFRSLADLLEDRSPLFKGRTLRLLRLATETNQIRDNVVDPVQLEAAVYMHDIGMMFLPDTLWLKTGRMTSDELAMLRKHTIYCAGLLSRMGGWEAAAEMVAQHHEMPDGKGYPEGLTAESICDGAKILSIVDAFESIMLKHASHGINRSVLRAIAEVNACDNQFAPEWIGAFNQVIHRTLSQ
jgi:HPt (histidine-containing phosphotransfer) domain-containing protein